MPAKRKVNNYIIDEVNRIAKIELRRRGKESLWTIIDLDDLDRVINVTWHATNKRQSYDEYYARHTIYDEIKKCSKSGIYLHVFIMNIENSDNVVIDHINGNSLDNRKSNLRIVEYVNNSTNRKSKNKNNKSGYRNVCQDKKDGKWNVQLQIDGRNTVLARFPEEQLEEAGKFAELMRTKYYGEFAGDS